MLRHLTLVLLALAEVPPVATPPVFKGVPKPPEAVYEAELTGVATERAQAEMKTALAQLESDPRLSEAEKRDIKSKLPRFRLALYTTTKTFDEIVFFYEGALKNQFVFAERDLMTDVRETCRLAGVPVDPAVAAAWQGKRGHSARWARDDRAMEIDIEDHLIDPRDGKVTRKTVVLISSVAP